MERLTDRIYNIAFDELSKQALGLEPLGLDVCWGAWDFNTPQGVVKNETLSILFAFRAMGPNGEVLLGNQPPLTVNHVLSGLYPMEAEIKSGVAAACNAVRAHIQSLRAPQNGHGIPRDPIMPLRFPKDEE